MIKLLAMSGMNLRSEKSSKITAFCLLLLLPVLLWSCGGGDTTSEDQNAESSASSTANTESPGSGSEETDTVVETPDETPIETPIETPEVEQSGQVTNENEAFKVSHEYPASVTVGENFVITLRVTPKVEMQAISVREEIADLIPVDSGDFIGMSGAALRALAISPTVGREYSYSFVARCESAGEYQLYGIAETRDYPRVWELIEISCAD